MADISSTAPKRRLGRSPAYPSIDLKAALKKAKALYEAEGKYDVPMPSAFAAWGYGAKSSGGRETRAALKYFGLITVDGDNEKGSVKLTENALRILLDEREDQTEKRALIQALALSPGIHKTLFDKYPEGIKSDASAEHFLVFDEGYNENAAAALVKEFKSTAHYAGLFQPDEVLDKEGEQESPDDGRIQSPPPPAPSQGDDHRVEIMPGERELTTGLLSKDASFRLIVNGSIGAREIDRLIAKLELDKEILADEEEYELVEYRTAGGSKRLRRVPVDKKDDDGDMD